MALKISRSMKDLFDLVPLVSRGGSNHGRVELLGKLEDSERIEARLYRALLKTTTSDEWEIASTLGLTPNDKKYGEAKSHLKRALLDELFFIDLARAGFSEYSQKLDSVRRFRYLAIIAESFIGSRLASELAQQALSDAIDIEDWSDTLDLISVLMNGAALSGDKKEWRKLKRQYWRVFGFLQAERETTEVDEQITLVFARSSTEHPELQRIIVPAIKKLEEIVRKHGTFKFQERLLDLRRKLLQVKTDYVKALDVADQGLALLEKYPAFSNRVRKATYSQSKLLSLIQLRRLNEAEELQKELAPLLDEVNDNWYYFQNWSFILLMHLERFEDARKLYETVMQSRRFNVQPNPVKQTWELFRLYADFFTGHALPGIDDKRKKGRTLSADFVKLFPDFKDDYAGYRMAAIVLEILYLMPSESGKNEIIARADSLKSFKSRRLRNAANTQSNLFINLMQLLEKHGFDKKATTAAAKPILKEMRAIKTIDEIQGMQVMSYEQLWSNVVSGLRSEY